MMMSAAGILSADVELCRADSCALHTLGPDRITIDGQAAQRRPNLVERNACIDQRADDHVAGSTGEAVEVQNGHNPTILLDARGQLPGLRQGVIPLVGKNEVIDDVNAHDVAGTQHPVRQQQIVLARRRIA
jgi:hypothetical protein